MIFSPSYCIKAIFVCQSSPKRRSKCRRSIQNGKFDHQKLKWRKKLVTFAIHASFQLADPLRFGLHFLSSFCKVWHQQYYDNNKSTCSPNLGNQHPESFTNSHKQLMSPPNENPTPIQQTIIVKSYNLGAIKLPILLINRLSPPFPR